MITPEIRDVLNTVPFDEKVLFYSKNFSLDGNTSSKLTNKLILISLLCLVSKKLNISVKEVLIKITKNEMKEKTHFTTYLTNLAIISQDLMYGVTEIDSFGLTTSDEIITKIKELLNEWIPF